MLMQPTLTQSTIHLFLHLFREPGKSKASFVLQKSRLFQRAIFFALLNPQPNGAGFAGVKTNLSLDVGEAGAESEGFLVQCRAQVSQSGKISSIYSFLQTFLCREI